MLVRQPQREHHTVPHGLLDEIIAWHMAKAQQMRWSRTTVQPFLDVRTDVLNDTLEDASRRRHPVFRPVNDDRRPMAAAA